MKKIMILCAALVFIIASCAVITVNIYFPEKDVKEAYKDLEKELMTPESGQQDNKQPVTPQDKPQEKSGSLLKFEWTGTAYAQESSLAEKITATVRKMPDVVAAYKQIGVRIPDLDRLRSSGVVGEANTGLLVVREGTLTPADKQIVDTVNENRMIVMRGMAKAIVRINRLPEKEENINQVMPQAVAQFASVRRDSAKSGWWIQDPDGNWTKK